MCVRGGGRSGFAGGVRGGCTLGNKSLIWEMGVTGSGFTGVGASVGEKRLHFGKQVACLGTERHGVRFRGCGRFGR